MQWCVLYSLQLLFFIIVIYLIIRVFPSQKKCPPVQGYPGVSLVVAFRNEAENIHIFLDSIIRQDYQGEIEVVLVNDQSTDNYPPIIASFKENHPALKVSVVESTFDKTKQLTSKQQALDLGIAHATHQWIAFTDADMLLGEHWLSSLVHSAIGQGAELIYGHTIIQKTTNSWLEKFQAFQLEFLFAIAYAFERAHLQGSCMGNNMLVSKKAYTAVNGQDGVGYSIVEDRDLLAKIRQKGFLTASTIPFVPSAFTYPVKSTNAFLHQMLRWIKGGSNRSFNLGAGVILFGVQNMLFLLSLIHILPLNFLWTSSINGMILFLLLHIVFKKTASKEKSMQFPLFYILICIETFIMLIPVLFFSPVWKSRKLK